MGINKPAQPSQLIALIRILLYFQAQLSNYAGWLIAPMEPGLQTTANHHPGWPAGTYHPPMNR